jgi:alpha-galactosidase
MVKRFSTLKGTRGCPLKIVIIGAGSRVFGPRSVTDILMTPDLAAEKPEIVMVDTDEEKLDQVYRLMLMIRDHLGSPVPISATTDRGQALPGADYVLIAVTQRRYELWEQDFRVPYAYGFRQAYGENAGPGALFHALRNIHLIMEICRDIQQAGPEAMVFNYSNPESRVLLAMKTLTTLNAVGLCHGQHDALHAISRLIGRPEEKIEILGGGINHLFWLYHIRDKETGEDLYPDLMEAARADTSPEFALPRKFLEIYGMLTYPDNTHTGEFVSFGAEFTRYKWRHGLESRPVTELRRDEAHTLEPYLSRAAPIEEIAVLSREMGAPMILAHAHNRLTRFLSGNVLNDGRYVPNVLPDGIVEVPVSVDGEGFHPESVPPLPEGVAAMVRTQMAIQKLTVEAYRQRSKNLILQALLLEPTVDSLSGAESLIDDMLELQAPYLPDFQ